MNHFLQPGRAANQGYPTPPSDGGEGCGEESLFTPSLDRTPLLRPQAATSSGPAPVGPGGAGFTITELLVVLAVASVLAAVAVPVITRGRDKARAGRCAANLREISRAVLIYAEEHKGVLPALEDNPPPGAWWHYKEQVKGYLGLKEASSPADRVFACPSDRGYGEGTGPAVPFCQSKKHLYTSYVFNGVTLPGVPNIAGWQVAAVKQPHRTLLVMEWTAHAPLSWHKSRTGTANSPFYDGAESLAAFVDGHVAMTRFYYDGINAAYTRDPISGYDYRYSGE